MDVNRLEWNHTCNKCLKKFPCSSIMFGNVSKDWEVACDCPLYVPRVSTGDFIFQTCRLCSSCYENNIVKFKRLE
jgi:hypothetical protein